MTDTTLSPSSGSGLRTLTHIAYGLFALGALSAGLFGVAVLAAVVLAYLKRPDAAGTVYYVHLDWLLATFWWALLWLAISIVATWLFIGWIGVAATAVWVVYRLIKGWLALYEGQAPAIPV